MNWHEILTIKQWHREQRKIPKPKLTKSKPTAEQKQEIKARKGEKLIVLAMEYNVSIATISRYQNELEL